MKKFATAVNCMDGRVQEPVINFLKNNYGVDYVDMITEPGPDKILAENTDKFKINSIKERVDISINKHGSGIILMVGHGDCAGNHVDKQTHISETLSSVELLKSWFTNIEVIPVWIDENWIVNVL
ncbi:MAG: hypothetical protein H8D45_17580 [Bacteroidetes bacterium]|nr:hypothetical protein [Bacteroidota bacterium]MBL7103000.1 hypothetical protein [Bacteroidales bacterium]